MIREGYTIGCVGLGNMGSAILSGLSRSFTKERLFGFDTDSSKAAAIPHLTTVPNMIDLVKQSDILVLAVKPDIISKVLNDISKILTDTLLISIAAGVSIDTIESIIGKDRKIIRAMPNTPAMVGEGMTVLSPNTNADGADIAHAEEIFSLLGKTLVMPEKYLNAVTALSGSGPAYGFTIIQAMADAGVKLGIPRDKALLLAAQTLKGSAEIVLSTGENPIALRDKVASPGGTTIAAIHTLERAGFSGILIDAIEEAARIAQKLGEKK